MCLSGRETEKRRGDEGGALMYSRASAADSELPHFLTYDVSSSCANPQVGRTARRSLTLISTALRKLHKDLTWPFYLHHFEMFSCQPVFIHVSINLLTCPAAATVVGHLPPVAGSLPFPPVTWAAGETVPVNRTTRPRAAVLQKCP